MIPITSSTIFFFFDDTATTEIYTLSLHDALPISPSPRWTPSAKPVRPTSRAKRARSEEHTSELQSRENLVCRLLLEKKKSNGLGGEGRLGTNAMIVSHVIVIVS